MASPAYSFTSETLCSSCSDSEDERLQVENGLKPEDSFMLDQDMPTSSQPHWTSELIDQGNAIKAPRPQSYIPLASTILSDDWIQSIVEKQEQYWNYASTMTKMTETGSGSMSDSFMSDPYEVPTRPSPCATPSNASYWGNSEDLAEIYRRHKEIPDSDAMLQGGPDNFDSYSAWPATFYSEILEDQFDMAAALGLEPLSNTVAMDDPIQRIRRNVANLLPPPYICKVFGCTRQFDTIEAFDDHTLDFNVHPIPLHPVRLCLSCKTIFEGIPSLTCCPSCSGPISNTFEYKTLKSYGMIE